MESNFKVSRYGNSSRSSSSSSIMPSTINLQSSTLTETTLSLEPIDTIYTSFNCSSDYNQLESRYLSLSHSYQQFHASHHFELHEEVQNMVSKIVVYIAIN